MLKLYSYQSSGNCYKVRLLLSQRGIDYQVVEIDVPAGEQRNTGHIPMSARDGVAHP